MNSGQKDLVAHLSEFLVLLSTKESKMRSSICLILLVFTFVLSASWATSDSIYAKFYHYVNLKTDISIPFSNAFFTPNNASFSSFLESTAQNLRCLAPSNLSSFSRH
ncbi:hypothetical protein ACH5RR_015764 [Cinchona calisaya]|uniref:Uncharacterized protein n=1 Tax=Cinchona calisaya TaxID=153742 RepID=A0ABD2ZXH6_9GENT